MSLYYVMRMRNSMLLQEIRTSDLGRSLDQLMSIICMYSFVHGAF